MITVYTRPGCPACVGTARYLERHELQYRLVDIAEDPVARYHVAELGYTSVPVVEVTGWGDIVTDHWCGLRIDRLNALSTSGNDSGVIGPW